MKRRARTALGSAWRAGAAFVGVCLLAKAANARETPPPSIWYRSSEGCPDGAAFVARLHGAAEGAKLATAGDRIDFVVTLGMKQGHAFGQLERQTAEGRVAIRELEAPRCEEVADAAALTLTLAVEPQTSRAAASTAAAAPTTAAATTPAPRTTPEPPPSTTPDATASTASTASAVANTTAPKSTKPSSLDEQRRRRLAGVDATLYKGSLPDPLLGARLFVEFGADAPWHGASARLAAFFTKRARETNPDIDLLLAGGRLDACPVAFFGPIVELRPCLAFELGWEHAHGTASTGVSDSAFWASGSASARVTWRASRAFGLEAEVGPTIPFTRYTLVEKETGAVIHRAEAIGLSAALGLLFGLP